MFPTVVALQLNDLKAILWRTYPHHGPIFIICNYTSPCYLLHIGSILSKPTEGMKFLMSLSSLPCLWLWLWEPRKGKAAQHDNSAQTTTSSITLSPCSTGLRNALTEFSMSSLIIDQVWGDSISVTELILGQNQNKRGKMSLTACLASLFV